MISTEWLRNGRSRRTSSAEIRGIRSRGSRGRLLLVFAACLSLLACSTRAQIENAQTAWDNGDFLKAAESYEQFLKDSPRHEKAAFARYQAATIFRRDLKMCEKAIPHYIHLIEDFPNSSDVYNARLYLAECYGQTDKPREAISEYENLLPFNSDEKEKRQIRVHIADLYYKMNDFGQAVAEYAKVTTNAPYDVLTERAWLQIGGIRMLRDDFEEAIPAYQTVAGNTQDATIKRQAQYRLADCYERTFQYDQAVKVLEGAGQDPKFPSYISQRIAAIRENQRQRSLSSSSSLGWPQKK